MKKNYLTHILPLLLLITTLAYSGNPEQLVKIPSVHSSLYGAPTEELVLENITAKDNFEHLEIFEERFESSVELRAFNLQNCPTNITMDADTNACGTNVGWTPPETTDPVLYEVEQISGPSPNSFFNVGGPVTIEYQEQFIGTDTPTGAPLCSFTVTVNDVTDPVLTPEANQDVNLNANCQIIIPNLVDGSSATDNCGSSITQSPIAGTLVSLVHNQTTNVTVTATDPSNRTDSEIVVITAKDNLAPVLTPEANQNVDLNANCQIVVPNLVNGSSATDNCSDLTITQNPLEGTLISLVHNQTTNVTVTVTDANNNTDSEVVVLTAKDNLAPVLTPEANQDVDLNANCQIVIPDLTDGSTVSDNCSDNTFTQNPTAGTLVSLVHNQTTNVTVTVTDANNNTDSEVVVLTAKDNMAPVLTPEANQNVDLNANCQIAVPNLVDGSSATDNCSDLTITQNPVEGTLISLLHNQTTNVTVTVTDANNNTDSEIVVLTAKDNIAPVLTPEANQNVDLNSNCQIVIPDLVNGSSVIDNCGATITQSPVAGTLVSLAHNGTTNVTVTATDANNNTDSEVVVLTAIDNIAPVLTPEANQDVDLNANCQIVVPNLVDGSSATDNCGATITQSPVAGTLVSLAHNGTSNVTVTATDANNNTDSEVVVLTAKDNIDPVLTPEANQDVDLNANCQIAIPDLVNGSSANDNCGATITQNPIAGTLVSLAHDGTTNVTVTATDANNNSDSEDVVITAKDNIAPVAVCQDITIQLDSSGNASITPAQIDNGSTDNCGIQLMELSKTTFDCSDLDNDFSTSSVVIPVILTVTDNNNLQNTCNANVTLLKPETVNNSTVNIQINQGSTVLCAIPEETLELEAITNNLGSGLTYTWLKNGIPVTDDLNPANNIYETTGDNISNGDIYTVETTSTIDGCVRVLESNEIVMTTNVAKPVSFTFNNAPTEVCDEGSITFSVSPSAIVNGGASSANPPTYQWFMDGNPIAGATNSSYTVDTDANPLSIANHTIRLEVSSNVQCATPVPAFQETTFTVNPLPGDISTNPGEVCADQQTTEDLTSLVVGYDVATDTFYANDTDANSGNSAISSTVDTAGTYWVRRELATGCFKIASITVNENPLPSIGITATVNGNPVTITNDEFEVCNGDSVVLIGDGSASNNWDNGITNNIAFSASATTTYTVTGTDNEGCSNTNAVTVIVNPLLEPEVTITGPENICLGQNSNYQVDTTNNTGSSPTFEWFRTNDGITHISIGTGNSISTNQLSDGEGIYVVMTPSTDICLTKSTDDSNIITVNGFNTLTDITTALNDNPAHVTNICPVENGLVYTLGSNDPNVLTYNWTVPNGFQIASGQGTHEITVNALSNAVPGNITVTTTNPCGNSSSSITMEMDTFGAVDAGPDMYVCAGTTSVVINGSTTGVIDKANEFNWSASPNNGSFNWSGNGYSAKINPTYTLPGNTNPGDTIVVTIEASNRVSNTCNNTPIEDTMTIYVVDSNVVNINSNSPVCEDDEGLFDLQVSNSFPNTDITIQYNIDGGGTQSVNLTTDSNGDANSAQISAGTGLTPSTEPIINVTGIIFPDNTNCGISSNSFQFDVQPKVVADAGSNESICEGETLVLTGTVSGGVSTIANWTILNGGPGSIAFNGTSNEWEYTAPTGITASIDVDVQLTSDDPGAPCSVETAVKTISVGLAPAIDPFTGSLSACESDTPTAVALTGVNLTGGATSGTWSIDSLNPANGDQGSLSNASDINIATYTPPANYNGTVTLTLTTNATGSCPAAVLNRDIIILPKPELVVMDDTAVCFDPTAGSNTVALSITTMNNITSGTWSSSGAGSFSPNANDINAVYNMTAADNNNGQVTLTFTSNDATAPCQNISDDVVITINEIISITSQPENTPACVGNNASLSIDAIGDIASYQWYAGDAADGTSDDTMVGTDSNILSFSPTTLADSGSYYVVLTAEDGCTSVTSTEVTLNVNETIFVVDQPDPVTVCERDNNNSADFTIVADGSVSGFDLYKVGNPDTLIQSNAGTYNAATTHTTALFTLSNISLADAGDYYIAVNGFSNACPDLNSINFALTVTENPDPIFVLGPEYCSNEGIQMPTGILETGGTFSATPTSSTTSTDSPMDISSGWLDPNTGALNVSEAPSSDFKIWYSFADEGPGGCAFVEYNQQIHIEQYIDVSNISVVGTSNIGTPTTGNGVAVCYDNTDITLSVQGISDPSLVTMWYIFDPATQNWSPLNHGGLTHEVGNIPDSRGYRVAISSGSNCEDQFSTPAYIDVVTIEDLEPQPVTASPTEFCIGGTSQLSSSVNYGGDILNQEGGFDQGQLNTTDPDGWLVDGELGKLSASGNAAAKPNNWSVTNDGKSYYGVLYDNDDPDDPDSNNGKFAIASGYHNTTGTGDKHPIIYSDFEDIFSDPADQAAYDPVYPETPIRITTMETPIFNLNGIDDYTFEFLEAFSLKTGVQDCETDENSGVFEDAPPAASIIEISTDGGLTYEPFAPGDFIMQTPEAGHNHRTSAVIVADPSDVNSGTASYQDFNPVQIDLTRFNGFSELRIRFTFVRNCESSWALEGIRLPGNDGAALVEWRDQFNVTISPIANTTDVTVTPLTPGLQTVNVRTIFDGCENASSIQEVPLTVYNAYAGENIAADPAGCGGLIQLHAYDNSKTPLQNYLKLNDMGVWNGNAFSIIDGGDGIPGWDVANSVDKAGHNVNGKYTFTNVPAGNPHLQAEDYRDYGPTNAVQFWTVNGNRVPEYFISTQTGVPGENDAYAMFAAPEGVYDVVWNVASPDDPDDIFCSQPITIEVVNCTALDWDGIDDRVNFSDDFNFNGSFSIELWVLPKSQNKVILSKKSLSDTSGYMLELQGPNPKFSLFNNGSSLSVLAGGSLVGQNKDVWNHIAITYDGSLLSMYVNGILEDSASGSNALGSNTSDFVLGGQDDGNGSVDFPNLYHGWMDELRIWNTALSLDQIREMMNQEIVDNGGVSGVITTELIDDGALNWADLLGYYQMNVNLDPVTGPIWDHTPLDCTYNPVAGDDIQNGYLIDNSGSGNDGRLISIQTFQKENAPIPYTMKQAGPWNDINTWSHSDVWNVPNSKYQNIDIDWNIVVECFNLQADGKPRSNPEETNIDYVLLGLVSVNGTLTVTAPGTQDENNPGNALWVTHYLKLDGIIDLVGESQLVQKRYHSGQSGASDLDPSSGGHLLRDQQGQTNLFNYNYFSPPVSEINTSANNTPYTVADVLKDGTNRPAAPVDISWVNGYNAGGTSNPISNSMRWIYVFPNDPTNTYLAWNFIGQTGFNTPGIGFTLKGSGVGAAYQNYTFVGKPNNELISLPLGAAQQAMVGNPYPSAIDANAFILDNQANVEEGTLYFWEHFDSNSTHILRDYEGGYALYNLSGGNATYIPNISNQTVDGFYVSGAGSFTGNFPDQYVPVGQGFFVSTGTGGGQLEFRNSHRIFERESDGFSNFLRVRSNSSNSTSVDSKDMQRIRIVAQLPNKIMRPLLLSFAGDKNASDGYDKLYDARSLDYYAPEDVFWNIENGNFLIQGVGDFDSSKRYPLAIQSEKGGEFSVALWRTENFEQEVDLYIYDALLDQYSQINDAPFKINLDAGNHRNRFYLTFETNQSLDIKEETIDEVYVNYLTDSEDILIKTPESVNVKQVYLINILGQTIKSWNATNITLSHEIRIPVDKVSDGNYIIKLETDRGTHNKKVIIKQ